MKKAASELEGARRELTMAKRALLREQSKKAQAEGGGEGGEGGGVKGEGEGEGEGEKRVTACEAEVSRLERVSADAGSALAAAVEKVRFRICPRVWCSRVLQQSDRCHIAP